MEDGQSWMMTTVKLEEEEEKEQILLREVKLSMSKTDSDDDDDDDEGCRRKAVLEELRHPDHVWDGMFAPKMEKSGEEETEEFSDVCSVKEELFGLYSGVSVEEGDRLINKCEVCKFLTVEMQEALERTGRSKEVLELGEVLDTGKSRRNIK
uniref:Canopy FGF signaling regulator 4 n=1 Tax=Gouania willdenowi TaxID=441366 RepID=A0A8C5DKD3_GOUWI